MIQITDSLIKFKKNTYFVSYEFEICYILAFCETIVFVLQIFWRHHNFNKIKNMKGTT